MSHNIDHCQFIGHGIHGHLLRCKLWH